MKNRYAISDIHGNYKTFLSALEGIQLSPTDELYLLGDYVDRGPESRQVISHIRTLIAQGYQIHCLRGNHEQYMILMRVVSTTSRVSAISACSISIVAR